MVGPGFVPVKTRARIPYRPSGKFPIGNDTDEEGLEFEVIFLILTLLAVQVRLTLTLKMLDPLLGVMVMTPEATTVLIFGFIGSYVSRSSFAVWLPCR